MANSLIPFELLISQNTPSGKLISDAIINKSNEIVNSAINASLIMAKAAWQITTSSATSVGTVDTPTLVAGTTTLVGTSTNFTMPSDNVLQYTGIQKINIHIDGILGLSGVNNDEIKIYVRKYDDSSSAYEDLTFYSLAEISTTGNIKNVSIKSQATLDQDDKIELWCENTSNGNAVTFSVGSQLILAEI